MLNPKAKGLFSKAIMHAGSANTPWGFAEKKKTEDAVSSYAQKLGCNGLNLATCLRQKSLTDIMKAQGNNIFELTMRGELDTRGVEPCLEVDQSNSSIVDEDPNESANIKMDIANSVPLLAGANGDEGLFFFGRVLRDFLLPNPQLLNADFLRTDAFTLLLNALDDPRANDRQYHQELLDTFFTREQLSNPNMMALLPGFVNLFGAWMVNGTVNFAMTNARKNPSYWYSLDFVSPRPFSMLPILLGPQVAAILPKGISHADEILYMFNLASAPKDDDIELKPALDLVQLHVNFIQSGNPGFGASAMPYMSAPISYLSVNEGVEKRNDYVATFAENT